MAILKALLVLASLFIQLHAATPPHVPSTEQVREQPGADQTKLRVARRVKIFFWSWAIFEISVLLSLSNSLPPSLARPILSLLPASITSDPSSFTAVSPIFLAGTFLMITGGLLRAYCFRKLGHHFTFLLSIHPSHELITDGLYGFVRHPSYTGTLMGAAGYPLCLSDFRPWVIGVCEITWTAFLGNGMEGKCHAIATSVFACLWVKLFGAWCVALSKRMNEEDVMLEKNFGDEWRTWAKRVPSRLIPGVY